MQRKTLLTLISTVGALGAPAISALITSTPVSAYSTTDFVLNSLQVTDISISINPDQVGRNDIKQLGNVPVSASFYKTADINVTNIDNYAVSVFLDCSALTGNNKTKCENGNLLTSSGDMLASVSSAKTFSTMSNEWGFRYNIGDSVQDPSDKYFSALPTNRDNGYLQIDGNEQIETDPVTHKDHKVLTLGFGAKVDGNATAGTYNGKVTIAVVASPSDLSSSLSTMQKFSHDSCAAMAVHDTAYLKDERDGKYYWVTKLEDQHCWMSQNLDLDIYANADDGNAYAGTFDKYEGNTGGTLSSTGVKLTKDNTDITTDTLNTNKLPKSTIQDVSIKGANIDTGDMSKNSWDQGLWVKNDPAASNLCNHNNVGISNCTAQFTDVGSGWVASDDPNFTNASSYKHPSDGSTKTKTAGMAIDAINHVYDAHYLIGNYYQFNAATAGSGDGLKDIDAPNSLCPKGWKLPSSGTQEDVSGRGSFYYMLNQYKVAGSLTGTLGGKTTNIALSPLFYVRSGLIGPNDANAPFRYTGQWGLVWSARAYSNTDRAYDFYFDTSSVLPSTHYDRFHGFSVRCVMY